MMDVKKFKALAAEAALGIKTQADLQQICKDFKKIILEIALNAELNEHLGYGRYEQKSGSVCQEGTKRGKTLDAAMLRKRWR